MILFHFDTKYMNFRMKRQTIRRRMKQRTYDIKKRKKKRMTFQTLN